MYRMRQWSVRNARSLYALYRIWEALLMRLHPLFAWIGYQRLDRFFLAVEKPVKGFLFDSRSCGQCTLHYTGMSCPMNCPKRMRNGPCGGVLADGGCEVKPEMRCVWLLAWEGRRRLQGDSDKLAPPLLPPLDVRLRHTSAWLRVVRQRHGHPELESVE